MSLDVDDFAIFRVKIASLSSPAGENVSERTSARQPARNNSPPEE